MKLVTVALVCLLVAGMWLQDANSKSLLVQNKTCCFTVTQKKISLSAIQCYRNSGSSCSYQDRVIFKMKGGGKRCASRERRWVKGHLPKLTICKPADGI